MITYDGSAVGESQRENPAIAGFTNAGKCVRMHLYEKLVEEESTSGYRTTEKSLPEGSALRGDVQEQMEDGFGEALLKGSRQRQGRLLQREGMQLVLERIAGKPQRNSRVPGKVFCREALDEKKW